MGINLFGLICSRLPALDARFVAPNYERDYTYSKMLIASARYANVLISLGVKPGDRIAVQVENSLESLMLYLATMRTGAIFLALHNAYTAGEIEHLLNDAQPRVIVCDPRNKTTLKPVAKNVRAKLETLNASRPWSRSTPTLFGKQLLASRHLIDVELEPRDVAAIHYNAALTLSSEGEVLSHSDLLSNALKLVDQWDFTKADVLLHALPSSIPNDLFTAANVTLLAGATMILLPDYGTEYFFRHLPGATSVMGGTAFYGRLLQDARLNKKITEHLRLCLSGAEPMPAEIHREWKDRTGHDILPYYGMIERQLNTTGPFEGDGASEAIMSGRVVVGLNG